MPNDVVLIDPEHMYEMHDAQYVKVLEDAGFEVIYPDDPTFSRGKGEEETIAQLQKCNAVLAGGPIITENVMAACPELRVIARSGVGYDRVDIPGATNHNIAVCITPNANHESVAEHALMLMLGVAKGVLANDEHSRAGRWPQSETLPIRGTTLGIIGLGRIGRSLAIRAVAMGMKVIAYWTPTDPEKANDTLIYVLEHASQEAANQSWQAFAEDPEWAEVSEASNANGRILAKVVREYMKATDYSPMQ